MACHMGCGEASRHARSTLDPRHGRWMRRTGGPRPVRWPLTGNRARYSAMATKESSATRRKERLRAALRENLKRRKAQARGRAALKTAERSAATRKLNDESPAQ